VRKKKLLFIGPVPKPLGGVSVHIIRLAELMKTDYEISHVDESKIIKDNIFNVYSLNVFKYLGLILNSQIIHIHSVSSIFRNGHILISKLFFKKVVVTIHSLMERSKMEIFIDKLFLKLADKVIVVSKEIGTIMNIKGDYITQYAFLPPDIKKEAELTGAIPQFLSAKRIENKKVFIANAWRLDYFNDQDLYGLDLCIEVAKKLVENNYNVAFVFVVGSLDKNNELFVKYKKQIQDYNLEDIFLLINEEISFSKLITFSDIVLRPTNTDGDALTIREGLYFNKLVIASDIVERPDKTILFKTRSVDDFYVKAAEACNYNDHDTSFTDQIDYRSIYLNIYK
jgi:glycosyltransferase involved in cell wall biosynthesis